MREIKKDEVQKLMDCLQDLAKHHNEVSENFKGIYPSKPLDERLLLFEEALTGGGSHIAVIEEGNKIVGFCKVDISGSYGYLDYIVVKEACRGKGYGKQLMDWAMEQFDAAAVRRIDVQVVHGNPAIHLYEKYGFKTKSHILGIMR